MKLAEYQRSAGIEFGLLGLLARPPPMRSPDEALRRLADVVGYQSGSYLITRKPSAKSSLTLAQSPPSLPPPCIPFQTTCTRLPLPVLDRWPRLPTSGAVRGFGYICVAISTSHLKAATFSRPIIYLSRLLFLPISLRQQDVLDHCRWSLGIN